MGEDEQERKGRGVGQNGGDWNAVTIFGKINFWNDSCFWGSQPPSRQVIFIFGWLMGKALAIGGMRAMKVLIALFTALSGVHALIDHINWQQMVISRPMAASLAFPMPICFHHAVAMLPLPSDKLPPAALIITFFGTSTVPPLLPSPQRRIPHLRH